MAKGAPDWLRMVQVAVTVEGIPVPSEPESEYVDGDWGRYSGDSTEYQPLATWGVPDSLIGELKEIHLQADLYDHTAWMITIGDLPFALGNKVQSATVLRFSDLRLAGGTSVDVKVKSNNGVAIVATAVIVGKVIGAAAPAD